MRHIPIHLPFYIFIIATTLAFPAWASDAVTTTSNSKASCKKASDGLDTVYFAPNSTELTPATSKSLAKIADLIQKSGNAQVSIIGAADESLRAEKNLRLGLLRATRVRMKLEDMGISKNSLKVYTIGNTPSLGKLIPNCDEGSNRKVQIVIKPPSQTNALLGTTAYPR